MHAFNAYTLTHFAKLIRNNVRLLLFRRAFAGPRHSWLRAPDAIAPCPAALEMAKPKVSPQKRARGARRRWEGAGRQSDGCAGLGATKTARYIYKKN